VKPAEAYRVTVMTKEPRVTLHLPRRRTEEYEWSNLVTVYTEIRNRLKTAIDLRLTRDRLLTNRRKYGTKAINPHLFKSTWSGLLKDEEHLPRDWIDT
jgi:hypothetical protein